MIKGPVKREEKECAGRGTWCKDGWAVLYVGFLILYFSLFVFQP